MESAFKETKMHGKPEFPYMVYNGKIPKLFTYFPMHWHEEFELVHAMEGRVKVSVEGKEYICEPGDTVLIPPDRIHDIGQFENEESHYCNIMFSFDLLEKDREGCVFKKYFEPFYNGEMEDYFVKADSDLGKLIGPLCLELFETRHQKYSTDELRVKANLYSILFRIKDLVRTKTDSMETREGWIERVKPILTYVSNNLAEEITVEQAADMCNLSKSHFMKIFKKVTGNSFLDYVKKCRLENAYYLLTETVRSVSEIGEECGFSNFSYFIRSFKDAYGMSPLQFRKKYLEQQEQSVSQ